MLNYQVPKSSGPIEICVEVIAGSVSTGLMATVTFSTIDISSQCKVFSVSYKSMKKILFLKSCIKKA